MEMRVHPAGVANLAGYIEQCCLTFGDRIAFIEGDTVTSYAEFGEKARALAAFLAARCGVRSGDRVAVMLPNITAFPISAAAILRIGAVQVNVNPFYTARELRHQLDDADAGMIVTDAASLPTLEQADVQGIHTVIVVDLPAQEAKRRLPAHMRAFSLDDALADGAPWPVDAVAPSRDDLAFLQYTGGTTGISKGAMLSHGNILANLVQFQAMAATHFAHRTIVTLTAIPLYHIFALTVNLFSTLAFGASNILISRPRDLDGLTAQWARHRVNFVTGVNTLFKGLCAHPGFAALDFAPELVAMGGGAPVQKIVSERWRELTGRHIREGYGLSETSPILTCTPFDEERFLSSIGMAVPDTQIVIRDTDGRDLPDGEVGELCARGPQVMQGYWRRPDETAAVMTRDGYFRTGDMAVRDEEGRFRIVDRQKDMILVSGFNVYPNEIEAAVSELAGVAECACVGQDDPDTGEAVAVHIVPRDPQLDAEQVREHCRRSLAAYKVPKHVHFISEMPKTSVGKILRRELRARRADGESATQA